MSRTNRSSIRRNRFIDFVNGEELEFHPELVPVEGQHSSTDTRAVLEGIIQRHRWQLVATAQKHLRDDEQAEDLVQDLCVEVLEGLLPMPADPTTAKANWLKAVRAYQAIDKQADLVVHDLKWFVSGAFGATSSKLADFGFTARKVKERTPEDKQAAIAQRAATRKARGTMGPKAKRKVRGETAKN